MTCELRDAELSRSVYPSGSLLATKSAARVPPAPGRFSMNNVWPICCETRSSTMRATVSPAFPAVNGLITLIGLAGQVSARAATVAIERATAAKNADHVRIDIMFCSRKSVMPHSITTSAVASKVGGTVRPSSLADFQIDDQSIFGRRLDRQIRRSFAF